MQESNDSILSALSEEQLLTMSRLGLQHTREKDFGWLGNNSVEMAFSYNQTSSPHDVSHTGVHKETSVIITN